MRKGYEAHQRQSGFHALRIEGIPVFQLAVKVQEPITEDGSHTCRCNSIQFHNIGETTAMINHSKTLLPGATWSIGSDNDLNILVQEFKIKFIGENPVNTGRIEIVEIRVNHPVLAHYVEKAKVL